MAFTKSVKDISPGYGSPAVSVQLVNVTANVGATAITFPTSGAFSPSPITNGRVRVKANTIGASATFIVGKITGTDGTTTVQLYAGDTAATSAGVGLDEIFDFRVDLAMTSVTVNVTVATANSTVDAEICGNP